MSIFVPVWRAVPNGVSITEYEVPGKRHKLLHVCRVYSLHCTELLHYFMIAK